MERNFGTDFVVGHFSGTPTTVYAGAHRYDQEPDGPYALDTEDATGRNAYTAADFPFQHLSPFRVADVYEAGLLAGERILIKLQRHLGRSELKVAAFAATVLPGGKWYFAALVGSGAPSVAGHTPQGIGIWGSSGVALAASASVLSLAGQAALVAGGLPAQAPGGLAFGPRYHRTPLRAA